MKTTFQLSKMCLFLLVLLLSNSNIAQQKNESDNNHLSMSIAFQEDSTLLIKANYTIANLENDEVYFLLNPGFTINTIKSEGLKNHEIAMRENRPFPFYKLNFDAAVNKSEKRDVYFEYIIDLKTTNHIKSNWIELNTDKLWFPNYNDLDNKFTWTVKFENLYKGYSIASYIYDEKNKQKTLINAPSTLLLEQNIPVAEVYLLMAKNMKLWENNNRESNIKINFFVHQTTPDSLLISMDEKLGNIINFFNNKFGQSSQLEQYLVVLRNTDEISFLQSRGEILLGNNDSDSYAAFSHEVAHYWWSDADFIREPWMNESFANYSMFLALEEFDKEALQRQIKRGNKNSENTGSVIGAEIFPTSNFNTFYHKGCMSLWELDQKIGRDALLKLLSARVTNKVNTTKDFLTLLEQQQGIKVRADFESTL